ncbi:hypothetical protein [Mycolicibacterium litorale]|uniref:Uncharacterized protein n=1 Tax=Mycolicibacterium litorale TaxID=758802 RepID=A0AAD1INJ9_9MYCO|nr:hypothetical protein [Mycolicibacterium litorale]MCV7417797.1 hypothetical protein [Mycolicibacterium litorale]TDY06814.1 hypothetical protein BCL50_3150 [Mycolicibacterium litorale]BBY19030.1 hypothetical protein MLIT_46220 [Mycolicibacterium litorale]
MAIDTWTTLASAGAGALAGAIASWVAAPHVAGRQQRGANKLNAREQINERAGRLLSDVRKYQAHARSSMSRDDDRNLFHTDDITVCGAFLTSAEQLGVVRKKLVRRRLVELYGPETVELCELHGDTDEDPNTSLFMVLNRQHNHLKNPERFRHPDRGLVDQALRREPESPEVERLIKSLSRLKKSR